VAEHVLARQGVEHRVDSDDDYADLPESTRVFLFHAIRELLINIVKHARATRASVSLNTHEKALHIEVRDDGVGIDTGAAPRTGLPDDAGGFGLFALRDRIDLLGGQMHIDSHSGTCISLVVPLEPKDTP